VWPGIVAVVLQWLSRFGIKAVIPGISGFGKAMMTSFAFTLILIIWWTFFSRARWRERLEALGVIALALAGTWMLRHESMWIAWLMAYLVPILSLAFVTWAVVTRRMSERVRHATMVATIVIACGAWLLVRQDGINGDHQATFGWRWAASPEERLLAQTSSETAAPAAPAPTASVPGTRSITVSVLSASSFARKTTRRNTSCMARLSWTKARRHCARREDRY